MSVAKTKVCGGCCKVMKKPLHQSTAAWEKQTTCSFDCAALRRRRNTAQWRETATKVCLACDNVFRPGPKRRRSQWDEISYCDNYCKTYGAMGKKVAPLPAEEQDTPGKRIHWLRISTSACGKKALLPLDRAAADAGIAYTTWRRIEAGEPVQTKDWQALCARVLGVPEKLLTVSVERWVAVVTEAGLSAKDVVVVEEERGAA